VAALSDKLRVAGAAPLDAAALTPLLAAAEAVDLRIVRRKEVLEKPTA
jgi:hypothetical protein